MNPNLPSPGDSRHLGKAGVFVRVLWSIVGYCAISCLTLPFIGYLWLGEFPVLALLQVPKVAVAEWLRTHVVMKAIAFLGLSQGSFSPDYALARPYGLAIAYLIPMVVIGVLGLRRFQRFDGRRGFATIMFLIAAEADYLFTIIFAEGRWLTIY